MTTKTKTPHAQHSEPYLLGSMIAHPHIIPEVIGIIKPEYLHNDLGRKSFELICKHAADFLASEDSEFEIYLLPFVASNDWVLLEFLTSIRQSAPSPSSWSRHATLIRHAYLRRQLAEAGDEARENGDPRALISELVETEKSLSGDDSSLHDSKSVLSSAMEEIKKAFENKGPIGVSTGFGTIDDEIGALEPDCLYVLAGRPSMGKSALALNMLLHIASKKQAPPLYISLEMSGSDLGMRALASESGVSIRTMKNGQLTERDIDRLTKATGVLASFPWLVEDVARLTVSEVKGAYHRAAQRAGDAPSVLFVDHLHLMDAADEKAEDIKALGQITRDLKKLTRELHIPIVLLCQLNRGLEKRSDRRPIASDLRGSGEIEENAVTILALYRDAVYNDDADPRDAELLILKNRNGALGSIPLRWEGPITTFFPYSGPPLKRG